MAFQNLDTQDGAVRATPRVTVLTFAFGSRYYFGLACNLARSFWRYHDPARITFKIVTDSSEALPRDLDSLCLLKRLERGELGAGFAPKLHIDQFLGAGPLLFLDSDILVYGSLYSLLDRLAGRAVAVIGSTISKGEWFGHVPTFLAKLGVATIPKFNGGLYYVEPCSVAHRVFAEARQLASEYDSHGLIRLRGHPNDELVIAGAMARHGLSAFPDDGTVMSDPQACPGPMRVNVIRGDRDLTNPAPPSLKHCDWNPFSRQSPTLVHFLGSYCASPQYRTEALRLRLAAVGLPNALADWLARVASLWPLLLVQFTKNLLRPVFRSLFGPRRIVASPRL